MKKQVESAEKERVVLYINYDLYELNSAYEKEKMLRKFCEDKNYDIVGVFRSPYYSDVYDLSPDIIQIMEDAKEDKFDTFLCYSLKDISDDIEVQTAITNHMLFCKVPVETIIEGVMNDDFFFGISLHENCNHKKELEFDKNPYKTKLTCGLDAYQFEEATN